MPRLLAGLGALVLVACAHPAAQPVEVATKKGASSLALSSAIVAPATTSTPTTVVLACHGEAFCREDVVSATDEEARTDIGDDCTRHRGTLTSVPCAREQSLASCSLGGEHGPIVVLTYPQPNPADQAEAVSTMKDLCEQMSGELATGN